jgi:FkbM family methyltransferase
MIERVNDNEIIDTIQTIPGNNHSKVLRRVLYNVGDVVDLGCYGWDWSNSFIGKKRVIGVDPIEDNIPENAELFKGVLGATNGKVEMYLNDIGSTLISNDASLELKIVDMIDWKTFCKMFNINKISVLKINIEGAEYDLLNSMDLDDFNNIDQIAISFHDWLVPEWKNLTDASLLLLKNNGFKLVKIYEPWNWYLAYKP